MRTANREIPRSFIMSGSKQRGVLIVEDEKELRALYALLLEGEDFTVFQAQDGQSALEVLQSHAQDIRLVITDLGIPRIGGVDLIVRARLLIPAVKIIGTSGLGGTKVKEIVMQAGADAFIPKPCSIQEVLMTVHDVMKDP